ncbi:YDG domain-containing protein, partial [Alcaligenaceae bacterium B3P038]|nr:YDG domain-containing protein [Alcaligenaceae bacterium B3P038]
MNHIYRSIWNATLGTFVAASEIASGNGKKTAGGRSASARARLALTPLSAALWWALASTAHAAPTGGVVSAGQASIANAPGVTTITQGSQNAAINWQGFSIGAGETVNFKQPNVNAVTLNRVVGSDPSKILGSLNANGRVFLVNPNGVMFAPGAQVNVGGIVASTLNISDTDLMAGRLKFSGTSTAGVSNQGSINAPGGYVALLGANVSNEGIIAARMGSVALAAGQAVTLDVAGDGLLNVTVDRGAVNALVNNGGLIQADGGQVLMTAQAAGNLLHTAVNNTGVVQAQTIDTRGGTIKLLGDMQTGTVNAGGTLDASAPKGGKGGFIDTSAAHVKIAPNLKVTTASASGLTGSWLIDPSDYNIAASGGDITGARLSEFLGSSNITVQSISGGGGTAGNINVNDTVSWSANKLTLNAQNNININAPMRGTGTASLALEYGQSAVAAGNPSTYNIAATVDLPTGNNLSTKLGSNGAVVEYKVINDLGARFSTTGNDLQGINGNLSGNYALGSNIDARSTATPGYGFVPLGQNGEFSGKLEGLGHSITGLTMSRSAPVASVANAGMFSTIGANAQVSNLGLVGGSVALNTSFDESDYLNTYGVGTLAGRNRGTITNVWSSGSASNSGMAGYSGYSRVGALVGVNEGVISRSRASGTATATNSWDGAKIGGLVGVNLSGGLIVDSSSSVAVSNTSEGYVGGLVGENYGAIRNSHATGNVTSISGAGGLVSYSEGIIQDSFATGSVTGVYAVGGLVGGTNGASRISNSYATGNVTASGYQIGGLVGGNGGNITNSYATGSVTGNAEVGGVVGLHFNSGGGQMTNVYSTGRVIGNTNVGGVAGQTGGAPTTITNGYFDSTVNSDRAGVGSGGTTGTAGLTTDQMRTAANFVGFNFTTTPGVGGNNWVIVNTDGTLNNAGGAAGGTGPMLASEYSTRIVSAHQLQLMAMNTSDAYTLGASFDAAKTAGGDVWRNGGFVPVGNAATPFNGSLDGTGHIISNLRVNQSDSTGLFHSIGTAGSVSNVGLQGGSVSGFQNVGALAGINYGTIRGNFSTASVSGFIVVGGLVGTNNGTIIDSYASGAVNGAHFSIGGLVGDNFGSVINSYASGAVGSSYMGPMNGGLVGRNIGTVTGSFWNTTTTGQSWSNGGGIGLTDTEIKSLATYNSATPTNGAVNPAWDLNKTWIVYEGQTAPLLRSFMTPLTITVNGGTKVYDGTAFSGGGSVTYSAITDGRLLGTNSVTNPGTAINAGVYDLTAQGHYSTGQTGYAITYVDGKITITPKALTITGVTAGNKVYDGTTSANLSGGTLSGLVGNETIGLGSLSGAFSDKNAGQNKAVSVGAILTDGTGSASNYTLATPTGLTASITPKALTVTGLSAEKIYDANTTATLTGGTLNGLVGTETLEFAANGQFSNANAGANKAINVTATTLTNAGSGATQGLVSNYALVRPTDVTGTITPKALTIVGMSAVSKTYDGTTRASVTGGSIAGLVGGQTLGVTGLTVSFSDANVGQGKSVIATGTTLVNGGNGGLASNYTMANPTGFTANITPKTLTLSGLSASDKTYDGTTDATLAGGVLSGLVSGQTLSLSGLSGAFADKNAGINKAVSLSGASLSDGTGLASNYVLNAPTNLTASINKATISSVSGITALDKVYDGNTSVSLHAPSSVSINGKIDGDSLDLISAAADFADKNAGTGKTVNITNIALSGADLANYTFTNNSATTTANITPKSLTLSGVTADNKVYDGNTLAQLSGGTLSGLVNGETIALSSSTGTFIDANAGHAKAVSLAGMGLANGSGLASNYTLAAPAALTADITPRALTVSGTIAADRSYDGTRNATLSGGTLTGLVGNETLGITGQTGTFTDKNAGQGKTVVITGTTLVNGSGSAHNYTVTDPKGIIANITPKALTITGMTAVDKVYNGSTQAALSGGSLNGLVGSETLGVTGLTAAFSDKNAGQGKTVIASGSTLVNGGNGGLASNYSIANPTGLTASIKPKALTVSGVVAANKTYDGSTAAALSGGTLNGLVGQETLGIASQTGMFSDKNAGTAKAVWISGTTLIDGTGLARNYTVSDPKGIIADITPRALTVAGMTAASKTYDGNTTAALSGGTLDGLVSGETLGLINQTGAFTNANAGNGKKVVVSGTTLVDGTGMAANYTVSNAIGVTANITPKALTVSGVVAANKTYDGNAVAALSGGTLNGLIGQETLGLTGQTGTFSDKNAGTAKAVTVAGSTLVDGTGLASNYTVANASGLTASITPKALSVSGVVAANKTYDGNTVAALSGGTLNGLIGQETLGLIGQTGTFSDKNAGAAKAVSVSGSTLVDGTGLASNYTVANASG